MWFAAQFVFAPFATISLGLASSHSFMSLPFLIVGLWKLGYARPWTIDTQIVTIEPSSPPPSTLRTLSSIIMTHYQIPNDCRFPETILYLYKARVGSRSKGAVISVFSDYANGLGTALHHSAASLLVGKLTLEALTFHSSVHLSPLHIAFLLHAVSPICFSLPGKTRYACLRAA